MLAPNFLATPAVVGSPIRISHHPSKTLGCHVSGSEEDLILENVEQIGWRSWDAQLTCPWRMGWGFDPLTVAVHRSAALPGHSFCTSASLLSKSYLWSCHFSNFLENIPYLIFLNSMDLSMDLLSVCCASTWAAKEMRTCRSALSVGESCARSHHNGPKQTCGINSMSCTKQDWWFFNKNRPVALSAKFCKIYSQIFIQIHARLKNVWSIAIRLSSFNLINSFRSFLYNIYIYIIFLMIPRRGSMHPILLI